MGHPTKIFWKAVDREGFIFEYKTKDMNALRKIVAGIPKKCHKTFFFIASFCKCAPKVQGLFVNCSDHWHLRMSYGGRSFHITIHKDPYYIGEKELYELKVLDLEREYGVL